MTLRLGLILAALAALAGLLWHDHHQTARANRLATTVNQLNADIAARDRQQAIDAKVTHDLLGRNKALEDERTAKPFPVLRLCKRAPVVPAPIAPVSDHAEAQRDDTRANEEDSGARLSRELEQYAVEAEQNRNGWLACQAWAGSR